MYKSTSKITPKPGRPAKLNKLINIKINDVDYEYLLEVIREYNLSIHNKDAILDVSKLIRRLLNNWLLSEMRDRKNQVRF